MDRSHEQYQSYTLRLARVADTDTWRATLYCTQNGKRYHFANLDKLYTFLSQSTLNPAPEPDAPQPSEL